MSDFEKVPGYHIWKDPLACTPFIYRWARIDFDDDGTAGQNHGGAPTYEQAVEQAKLHKQAIQIEKKK
jgi:hypothetical protein